jgi:hypothetical protein
MKLESAGSRRFPEVNEQQLRQTFDDDERRGEFVILSQAPEVYLQASGEEDGPYSLEYRAGDADQHFSAAGELRKADVLRAFVWYLAGDARWQSEFSWEKLDL